MTRRNLYLVIAVGFLVVAVLNFINGSILAGVLFAIAAAIASSIFDDRDLGPQRGPHTAGTSGSKR